MPQTELTRKDRVAEGTMAFWFRRPEGFEYQAGQAVDLTLQIDGLDDDTRHFTIASAPGQPEIAVATRLQDTSFKNALRGLEPGVEVSIDGPSGSFLLHDDDSRPGVFLAGGIGITPFRAMIHDIVRADRPHAATLFYSNTHPEDAAFLDELQELASSHPRLEVIPTMTGLDDDADWTGETDHIDEAMLRRHLGDLDGPVFYAAGPPDMVRDMQTMLREAGVPNDAVRTEAFVGY